MGDGPERVDPSGIPEFTGDLGQLATDHAALTTDAGSFRTTGSTIHERFGKLESCYKAPEADQLFATTSTVETRADGFADQLEKVGTALSDYADEITPIVSRLNSLRSDAHDFVAEIKDDDEWQYDGDKVERNNQLIKDISTTVGEFWAAERTAANKITALVGGTQWKVDDGSGGENMYGMSVDDMAKAGETPWGKAVEEKHHWYEIGHHLKSFVWDGIIVDGIWGTITGLGTLLNPWSDNFGAAWKGLGQLATGLALLACPLAFPLVLATKDHLPGPIKNWVNDSLDTTLAVGKSLIAWDEWSKDPAKAAGLVTFNVLTTVATLGTGTAVKGTATGASAATKAATIAARVGTIIDPMTYVAKGLGAGLNGLTKISTVTGKLIDLTALKAIELPDGTFRLPDNIELPPAGKPLPELPPGTNAVELPDNSVRLPDGSTLLPDGTLKPPDGINQTPDTIPVELSAADRALLDGTPPDLVEVGANQVPTGVTAHVGDGLPGGATPGDLPGGVVPDVPGGAVPNVPGGTVPHVPGGGPPLGPTAEFAPPGGSGLPETPGGPHPPTGTGPLGDGPVPTGTNLVDNGLPTTPGHDLPTGPGNDLPTGLGDDLPAGWGDDLPAGLGDDLPTGLGDDLPTGLGDDLPATPDHDLPTTPDDYRPGTDPNGPEPPKPDEHSTPEQQKTWDEYWVNRANTEGRWPSDYYKANGHRFAADSGVPKIHWDFDTHKWVPTSKLPTPLPPKYLPDAIPPGTRQALDGQPQLSTLDDLAAKRHQAIEWDSNAAKDLTDTKSAYDANPTPENLHNFEMAEAIYKTRHTEMSRFSEDFGEAAAEQVIPDHYKGATQQPLGGPPNGNHQFDQVWKTPEGKYVVIEAKSSTGTSLGARTTLDGARVSQGTRAYFDDIIARMELRGETDLAGKLKAALDAKQLDYIVVKGKPDGATYGGYTMRKFNIG
ncbi:hypothetical protein LO772_13380 [Yinghuangia sp. ASG 101]|uniref:hypothetical protein n=1 Tax=Yinghuangia sp. ASG 101 TaxID=2896848 RepID=UPI001E4DB313|nr:hypothetical protein [Yinghuangia sp. ASG 101]UGQ14485.1 hypothetical protein LO772_13380 [Yinghuangia sp. ASG 101]